MSDDLRGGVPLPDAAQMVAAPRKGLIHFLACAIGEFTIAARAAYEPVVVDQLMRCNEAIHRLSGHLRDLADPDEPMTHSRADGILEQLSLLPPGRARELATGSPL